jgi:hypothetical protein
MNQVFNTVVSNIANAFSELSSVVHRPVSKKHGNGYVYRFAKQGFEEAIVLKLARLLTLLQSGKLLLDHGFLQEVGAIQRSLDEVDGDIFFLCGPLIFGAQEPAHNQYLNEFFSEEFDKPEDPLGSTQRRHRVKRSKIRAYNARVYGGGIEVERAIRVLETIDNAYSGFVHAASVHTMDMYYGDPPTFHIYGMKGTSRHRDSEDDFKNYIYRSLTSTACAAKAFDREPLFQLLYALSQQVTSDLEL